MFSPLLKFLTKAPFSWLDFNDFLPNQFLLACLVREACHLDSSLLNDIPGTQVLIPSGPLLKPASFIVSIFLLAKSIDISTNKASTSVSFFNLLLRYLTNLTTCGLVLSVTLVTKVKLFCFLVCCPIACNSARKSFPFTGFLSFFLLSSISYACNNLEVVSPYITSSLSNTLPLSFSSNNSSCSKSKLNSIESSLLCPWSNLLVTEFTKLFTILSYSLNDALSTADLICLTKESWSICKIPAGTFLVLVLYDFKFCLYISCVIACTASSPLRPLLLTLCCTILNSPILDIRSKLAFLNDVPLEYEFSLRFLASLITLKLAWTNSIIWS